MSQPGSSRHRLLLRDLDRLDRRRVTTEAESSERMNEDDSRRQRLQRVLARLSRLQETRPPYGAPPTQQSLYDWAPASEGHDDEQVRRRQLHRRHESLRSAAIMQNAARTSVRSPSGSMPTGDNTSPEPQDQTRASYRRGYLAENPSSLSDPARLSPLLESAVQYLDSIREYSTCVEVLCSVMDNGLVTPESQHDFITDLQCCPPPQASSWLRPGAVFRGSQHTTSTKDLHYPTVRSSSSAFDATRPWLSHTPLPPMPTALARDIQDRWPVNVTIQAVDLDNMTMAGTMEAYDVPNASCPLLSSSSSSKQTAPITTYLEGQIIDTRTHSFLTPSVATSEAHAIAFPPTSALTDAANWRNLPPFNAMKSDEHVARALVSQSQMSQILSEWIFMRWKERCFIHSKSDPCYRNDQSPAGEGDDTDTGHGLTISGFYYVSLRRSDGNIDGLYFDTKTSPYQHLRLEQKNGGNNGVWGFT